MLTPAFLELKEQYGHLPTVLQQAIIRAKTHLSLVSTLTPSCRDVLADLISRADKRKPDAPVKVNLETVATTLGISYKTVIRAIQQLETHNLIARMGTARTRFGRFKYSEFSLTEELRTMLGLPAEAAAPAPDHTEVYFDKATAQDRRAMARVSDQKEIALPEELRELENKGINLFGICKLRGIAARHGHKLENVWKVAKQYTKDIQAGRLFNYLLRMTGQTEDYAARAQQAERIESQPQPVAIQQAVAQSHAIAEQKIQEAISGKSTGRNENLQQIKALLQSDPPTPKEHPTPKAPAPTAGLLALLKKTKGLSVQSIAKRQECPTVYTNDCDLNLNDHGLSERNKTSSVVAKNIYAGHFHE